MDIFPWIVEMKTQLITALCVCCALGMVACKDKKADTSKAQTPKTTPTDKTEPAKDNKATDKATDKTDNKAGAKDEKVADSKKDADKQPPKEAMEKDPNATDTVKAVQIKKDELPEGYKSKGKFINAIGWTDKFGRNAVFFFKKTGKGKAMLTASHMVWEGSSWEEVRTYKELVQKCEFDIELSHQIGKWSVTDIDKNGHGEATFAWHAGCRSDVSPVTHKVLLVTTEKGKGTKYVLRGQTRVEKVGGKYKMDPAFAKAPKGFLVHAKVVWKATAEEKMK